MGQFLFYYVRPEPATWVYMSTFLTIGLYFMFSRLWSLRNLDILLLLLLTPGLMMVYEGRKQVAEAESNNTALDAKEQAQKQAIEQQPAKQTPSLKPGTDPSSYPTDSNSSVGELGNVTNDSLSEGTGKGDDSKGAFGGTLPKNANGTAIESTTPQNSNTWSPVNLQYGGYLWLLSVIGLLVIRMLLDTSLVRRPMLSPNLTVGGLAFLGVSLFLFLMANILTSTAEDQAHRGMRLGPGYVLLNKLPDITTIRSGIYADRSELDVVGQSLSNRDVADATQDQRPPVSAGTNSDVPTTDHVDAIDQSNAVDLKDPLRDLDDPSRKIGSSSSSGTIAARIIAMISNLVIVGGIIAIGGLHFGNLKTGIGAAVFCTLMPYTAQMSGRIDHVLPAAMLVLAILAYRQPVLSGLFVGCAAGLVYFPFFLLPLWMSFYWQRGLKRFCVGLGISICALAVSAMVLADNNAVAELRRMFGLFPIASENLGGVWGLGWHPYFRLPVLVGFGLLSFSFTLWPAQKNLATLLSCSSAIMMAAQFGHGYGGGLFMAWFLPLATLCVFRPNLDDRIAIRKVTLWGKTKAQQTKLESQSENDSNELAQAS